MEDQIRAARNGSNGALGRALEGCRQYLLLIANQELQAELHAKVAPSDLVQETFLEAQRDFPCFDGSSEDDLLAWLRQILLNNIHDATRRFKGAEKRDVTRERSLGVTESGFPGASFLEPTTDETPSWLARLREKNELLHAALSRLSDDHRRVIILRNLELHSFVDIARLMNRTPDAIRKLWMRALTALEQEMGGLDVP